VSLRQEFIGRVYPRHSCLCYLLYTALLTVFLSKTCWSPFRTFWLFIAPKGHDVPDDLCQRPASRMAIGTTGTSFWRCAGLWEILSDWQISSGYQPGSCVENGEIGAREEDGA